MGIGLVILMASTVSILVSNMDNAAGTSKTADYFWPQPKTIDDFQVHKDVPSNNVDKLVKNEGGVKDKGGGAGDTHVEQYPDKPIKATEASEAKQSSMSANSSCSNNYTYM